MSDEDHKAIFLNWLKEHSSSVVQVARAYSLTADECQDLAQEILLQAWQSMDRFEGKASAATWFYRIALHTAMNWHRNDQLRRRHQHPWLEVHMQPDLNADPTEQSEQRESIDRLYKAIHQLPKTDVALVLLYLDEMSYREMASVLGLTESNVGVRLNRAKQTLATLLDASSTKERTNDSR